MKKYDLVVPYHSMNHAFPNHVGLIGLVTNVSVYAEEEIEGLHQLRHSKKVRIFWSNGNISECPDDYLKNLYSFCNL